MGMAMASRVLRMRPVRLVVGGGQVSGPAPPVVEDHQVDQGDQAADGDAADGAGGGVLAAKAQVEDIPGQGQAHQQLGQGLQHLGHGGGHHVRVALGIAPVGGHGAHEEAGQGHHPHGGGGQAVPLEVGQVLGEEEHHQAADGAQDDEGHQTDPEDPVHLVAPVQGVGLGDGLGHGHRQAGGGDHEQQVIDGVSVVEVAEAHVPQDAAQGDFVQGADDLHDGDADGQDGRAAEKGVGFLWFQSCRSLRFTGLSGRPRRAGAGHTRPPRPGSFPGPGSGRSHPCI